MDKKALWNRVCMTDPAAVKPITGKQYSGNSPKPYWIVERLTDEFGPCGIGWGFSIINERFERFSDTDTLHIAAVRFWYVIDGQRGELEQIGQTKASYVTSSGKFMLDEDAPKKSVTDALVKCASYLGFAGDIFSGRWDDSKYVAEARAEWESRKASANDAPDERDPFSFFNPQQQKLIRSVAQSAIQQFSEGKEWSAFEEVSSCIDKLGGNDDFARRNQAVLALNAIFKPHSALRAYLKDQFQQQQKKEAA